jgi:hypothetical protein
MKIVKLYRKPDKPEFYILVRSGGLGFLVNYPIDKPDTKRIARWFNLDEVYIDWVREFV